MRTKINITKRIKVLGKDRFCPAAFSSNGRLKPGMVLVNGAEERHPGIYYLDWTQKGKRKRVAVGTDATLTLNRKIRKEAELEALAQGIVLQPEKGPLLAVGTDLRSAIDDYLEDTRLDKKPTTLAAYTKSLDYFFESCTRRDRTVHFVEEIEVRDMRRFTAFLRDAKQQGARSRWNKFNNVMSFLKRHKRNHVIGKMDWPSYTKEDVEIYEKEDLDALWTVSTLEEKLIWEFFLKTGMRSQEVTYFDTRDINFKLGTVRVRHKPEYDWTPKAYKEREIPVPDDLLVHLHGRPKGLLFRSKHGKPETHFWSKLQIAARRTEQGEDGYFLHKFRATFATRHLQNGVDLRTVMSWMGHSDIASTMRYLKPARNADMRNKVNATFL